MQRGYWMVNWFKREFGLPEQQRMAAERGVEPESAVRGSAARRCQPGSMGLVVAALLVARRARARAGREGRDDRVRRCAHARPHLPRHHRGAGLMRCAMAVSVTGKAQRPHDRPALKVSGGGSQSDEAMQITADISSGLRPSGRTPMKPRAWARRSTPPLAPDYIRTTKQPWTA